MAKHHNIYVYIYMLFLLCVNYTCKDWVSVVCWEWQKKQATCLILSHQYCHKCFLMLHWKTLKAVNTSRFCATKLTHQNNPEGSFTLRKLTTVRPWKQAEMPQKRKRTVFQSWIFRCELLVAGRVNAWYSGFLSLQDKPFLKSHLPGASIVHVHDVTDSWLR